MIYYYKTQSCKYWKRAERDNHAFARRRAREVFSNAPIGEILLVSECEALGKPKVIIFEFIVLEESSRPKWWRIYGTDKRESEDF